MMNCSRILTRRVTTALPLQAYKSVASQSFSALVSIEDEFPGYVAPKNSTGTGTSYNSCNTFRTLHSAYQSLFCFHLYTVFHW